MKGLILLFINICMFANAFTENNDQEVKTLLNKLLKYNENLDLRVGLIESQLRKVLLKLDDISVISENSNGKPIESEKNVPKVSFCETIKDAANCELDQDDPSIIWTVIQRRLPTAGRDLSFYRTWDEYKNGFGSLNSEFWLGNDKIHELTKNESILRIEMVDEDGVFYWAQYDKFMVQNEKSKYKLRIDEYSGNATDSLGHHDSLSFSTYDNDNDLVKTSCARTYRSGWWFSDCVFCNLNGHRAASDDWHKIVWWWEDTVEKRKIIMRKAKIMIRKKYNPINIDIRSSF